MKTYKLEVVYFEEEDVICTSAADDEEEFGDNDTEISGDDFPP